MSRLSSGGMGEEWYVLKACLGAQWPVNSVGGYMRTILSSVALFVVASNVVAMPLDLDNPNGIAAMWSGGEGSSLQVLVVCTDGTGQLGSSGNWVPTSAAPVPLSQVADWTPLVCYTTDGRWFQRGSLGPNSRWELMDGQHATLTPPPCFTPVGAAGKSMGSVKSLFR